MASGTLIVLNLLYTIPVTTRNSEKEPTDMQAHTVLATPTFKTNNFLLKNLHIQLKKMCMCDLCTARSSLKNGYIVKEKWKQTV